MFPYISDGNQKLLSLIFDFSINILLRHGFFSSAQHLPTISFTKEMAGFPNKEKYFTPCRTFIFEIRVGAQICTCGLARPISWQFRIWSQPTQLFCAAKCVPRFLEHCLENSAATETTKGGHSFCEGFTTYHLSRAGIHLAKGNVQIKARHVYLVSWVRRERQFQAHNNIFQLKMVLKLCKCLPNTNCGYSIKYVFDLWSVLNNIFCRTLRIVLFSQNPNNKG